MNPQRTISECSLTSKHLLKIFCTKLLTLTNLDNILLELMEEPALLLGRLFKLKNRFMYTIVFIFHVLADNFRKLFVINCHQLVDSMSQNCNKYFLFKPKSFSTFNSYP